MNIGLYQSASSLAALERWQDAVTQNITSSQVTSFKKRTVQVSAVETGELQMDPSRRIDRGEGTQTWFPRASYGINFRTGETQPTGRELDIALQGAGFFEIEMPDGSRGYTRAGELRLRADRTLVTSQDMPILTELGTEVQLLPQGGKITITSDGTITQGDTPLGKLSVVNFDDLNELRPLSAGVFVGGENVVPAPVEQPAIMQGYLEGSNITALREMVDLVNIARAYEANQKLIQNYDSTLQKALDALG